MSVIIQDYDWADEVLHAQFGRKWLVSEFGETNQALEASKELMLDWRLAQQKMLEWSNQQEWWPQFMAEVYKDMNK